MSQEKGIHTSFTSLTSGVLSQLVSNSSKMFSKFKVKKPSNFLYKRGVRLFEAEQSGNILLLPIVETYDKQIRLMCAEVERLNELNEFCIYIAHFLCGIIKCAFLFIRFAIFFFN